MPSVLSNDPFLALRHDATCHARSAPSQNGENTPTPFSSLTPSSPVVDGNYPSTAQNVVTNGNHSGSDHEFLKLSKPQQDVLLLHGPRQRYTLEKTHAIPELHSDREILVQVVAIGLNPVDWKGPDYGNPQPNSYCKLLLDSKIA